MLLFLWVDSLIGRTGSHSEVWCAVSGLWLFSIRLECMSCSASQTWFAKVFIVFPFWGAIRYNISYWFWNCFYNASKHLSEKPCTNHRKMWPCGSLSVRISIAIGLWRVFFLLFRVLLKIVLSMENEQFRRRYWNSFCLNSHGSLRLEKPLPIVSPCRWIRP